jgi:hypothetical protein
MQEEITLNWHKRAAIAAALVMSLSIGFIAAACGDDNNTASSSSNASQASVDDLSARLQQDEMLNALVTIEALKLHEIDDGIQAGKPDERAVPDVRKFVRVMALTNWTADLKEEARKVHDSGVELLKALEDGDVDAAKGPSDEAHEGFHDFADKAWNVVVKDLPPDEGGPEQHQDDATPAAGATP